MFVCVCVRTCVCNCVLCVLCVPTLTKTGDVFTQKHASVRRVELKGRLSVQAAHDLPLQQHCETCAVAANNKR